MIGMNEWLRMGAYVSTALEPAWLGLSRQASLAFTQCVEEQVEKQELFGYENNVHES